MAHYFINIMNTLDENVNITIINNEHSKKSRQVEPLMANIGTCQKVTFDFYLPEPNIFKRSTFSFEIRYKINGEIYDQLVSSRRKGGISAAIDTKNVWITELTPQAQLSSPERIAKWLGLKGTAGTIFSTVMTLISGFGASVNSEEYNVAIRENKGYIEEKDRFTAAGMVMMSLSIADRNRLHNER